MTKESTENNDLQYCPCPCCDYYRSEEWEEAIKEKKAEEKDHEDTPKCC